MMKLLWLHLLVSTYISGPLVLCAEEGIHPWSSPTKNNKRVKRDWVWNEMSILEEQTKLPYYIGKLKIREAKPNSKFAIAGDYANSIFRVKEDTGDIYGFERLDRETKPAYNLTALFVDRATNKILTNPEVFTIRLIDINDNAPVFTKDAYNASVTEMSNHGTFVTAVTAVDADDPTVGGHAIVTYKIVQGQENFVINDSTGVISTVVSNLDREKQASYEIIVQAKDSPGLDGGFSSTATVTIHLNDINDNFPTFTKSLFTFDVPEDRRVGDVVGKITVQDLDEPQNRNTKYTLLKEKYQEWFQIRTNAQTNEGIIILKKPLDYEGNMKVFRTLIEATDPSIDLRVAKQEKPKSTTEVVINVLDVDEPPEFSKPFYHFTVKEDVKLKNIGVVSAVDPDAAKRSVRYSANINVHDSIRLSSKTGSIYLEKPLDRETNAWYNITVTAEEIDSPTKKASSVNVYIEVEDINDNAPEFAEPYYPKVCENSVTEHVILRISATDKDIMLPGMKFTYYSAEKENNFTVQDNRDNTASIIVKNGAFNRDVSKFHYLPIVISDNGAPPQSSTNTLTITVCKCNEHGEFTFCEEAAKLAAVSVPTLIIIFISIFLVLLVVTILLILKRMQNKSPLILGKHPAEIHEQLVTYDEEGGGEMDTNSYDVSVLNSVRRNVMRPKRELEPGPMLYAQVQKPSRTRDMFSMIEAKKEDADNDGEGLPYDTLHIFGYEGSASTVESLSSLESGSSDSEIDYDVLNDWGPRFKMLADLYGLEQYDDFTF